MEKKISFEQEEEILEQYEAIRQEFFYPPTSIELDAPEEAPFYIQNGDVHINPKRLKDEKFNKAIFRHEVAHFCVCPISMETNQDMYESAKKGLGISKSEKYFSQDAHTVSNVVADIIVDADNFKRKADPIEYRTKKILEDPRIRKSIEEDPVKNVLMGVVNKFVGKELVTVKKENQPYADKLYKAVLESYTPFPNRTEESARILKDLIEKSAEEQMKQLEKDFDKFMEKAGFGKDSLKKLKQDIKDGKYTETQWKDAKRDEIKIKLTREEWEALKQFAKDVGTTGQTMSEGGEDENRKVAEKSNSIDEYKQIKQGCGWGRDSSDKKAQLEQSVEYYKAKAFGNICFKVKVRSDRGGKIVKGGLVGWRSDDDPEELDVEETIGNAGIAIPDVTTVKFDPHIGVTHETETVPKVQIIYDVSGSMPMETALITIYSLIESAKANYIPVSVVTFSDRVAYSSDFSYEYTNMEQGIYSTYRSGGTNMLSGVNEAKRILTKEQNPVLVIVVSDFDTDGYYSCIEGIKELAKKHKICPLKFGGGYHGDELKPIKVKNLDDLKVLVIEELNKYVESARKPEGEQDGF